MSRSRRLTGTSRTTPPAGAARSTSSAGATQSMQPPRSAPPTSTTGRALRREPRAHWLLLLLTLAVAATALLFSGYGRHEMAGTAAPAGRCTWVPERKKVAFFLSGTQVAAQPDLVRRIRDEGHQIGSHAYTDADLGGGPPGRAARAK
ncbi:polysaccharide deacetylase family protein [Streptomyces sp. NPDC002577]